MDIYSADHETIQFMKQFTDIYQKSGNDIYNRELNCLKLQLPFQALPLRSGDLIAGRRREAPIGFQPQNSFNSVGYYCAEDNILEMIRSDEFSDTEKEDLQKMLDFWKENTTCKKIYDAYPEDVRTSLTHGDFNTTPGSIFPLYRMSGAQMDPSRLLKLGIAGMIRKCEELMSRNPSFYSSLIGTLQLLQELCVLYRDRCLALYDPAQHDKTAYYLQMADNLQIISSEPPATFWQAAQLGYLFFLFSGSYNYGRMDDWLGPYYCHDIDTHVIDESFALRIVSNLWDLINERETLWDSRVILGGNGLKNPEEAKRFDFLAMEAVRLMHLPCPQLTLRFSSKTDDAILQKALEVIGAGTTYPMLYNDDVNIPAVCNAFDLDPDTARQYVPFGCGEYVIYNQSFGTPSGAINLLHILNNTIYGSDSSVFEQAPDFESFYNSYMQIVDKLVTACAIQEKIEYDICASDAPFLMYSLLFDDCLERGLPMFEGGVRYLQGTLETYGNVNTSDSLTAIRYAVFEQKILSKSDLQKALHADFKNYDLIRRILLSQPKYGNDRKESDEIAVRFHEDLCKMIRSKASAVGLHSYLPVLINNSMNTTFGLNTGASADGRMSHTFMANANNPMNGMDQSGITAMLNSLLKLRPDNHAGSVQNMRFSGEMFGPLLDKTKALLHTYFSNGGTQAMITVLNRGDLEDAMAHPECYPDLLVRVGGFSARFIDLSYDVQLELISRTLY